MSLGQTMLSIATLVALTIMVVTSQQYLLEGQKEEIAAECLDLATAQCEALLAEISKKYYDASVTYYYFQSPTEFTAAASLGPNSSEQTMVVPWPDLKPYKSGMAFNDVDDYNNYVRIVNTDLVSNIQLTVQVYYVAESNLSLKVYYQTYYKRIVVTARQSTYMTTPITFSALATY